jgi:hydroxyacylglutathione hydrolase
MLYIQPFTFNPFQENTYLIINDKKQCWIVDPGMFDSTETNFMLQHIEQNGLQPQAIINTHAHIDHILGVNALKQQYGIQLGIHEKDMPVLNNAKQSAAMFGFPLADAPTADFYIKEGEPLMLGEDMLEVRFTPGHSPGSIVFYYKEGGWLVGGDVLFSGSIGRTDLPGGNFDTLIDSIRTQLFTLPAETVVLSGHGPSTTIGREQTSNPFLT